MASSAGHTLKAFDEDLEDLRAEIAALGGLAEAATRDAMAALLRLDSDLVAEALARARAIPSRAAAVERRALCLIALRAPRADDLREVLGALKIVTLIERMATQAQELATAIAAIDAACPIASPRTLGNLARVATESVRMALDAFVARRSDAAERVEENAAAAEALYATLLEACLEEMRCHPGRIARAVNMIFVARGLARIASQAGTLASAVRASVSGVPSKPPRFRTNADLMECR